MQTHQIVLFVCIGLGMFAVIGGLALLSNYYTLNGIKSRTVGDGQHGTARFATEKEIRETYAHISLKNGGKENRFRQNRDWWSDTKRKAERLPHW